MAQQVDIVANLLMKVDGAEAGINKLKNSLSKLKMPEGLENSFKKSFSNLDTIFAKYRSQVEKGFNTKGDVSAFSKTSKELDAELNRISKHFTELTGKQIDFKVKSDSIVKAEKDLQNLIAQKEKLGKDTLQFKIDGGKGKSDIESLLKTFKEIAGVSTNAGKAANNVLGGLGRGDITSTLNAAKQLEQAYQRLGSKKKDLFSSTTGLDMGTVVTALITQLTGVENKFKVVDGEIKITTQDLARFKADQIGDAASQVEKLSNSFEQNKSAINQANGAMQDYARSSQSMSQQLGDLQQSTQYFFSLRNMINLFKRGIDSAIDSVKQLDKAMTDTAVVTDYSVSDMWGMLPEYTKLANELGATTQGAYETMTLYFQQGLDQTQAFEIGAETMKMARIAGLDYAKTTDMMTAALRGFNMELNEASAKRINDVYSELAARTASDTEEIGEAMERTASIAHSAGMSFEGTSAFLAQMIETTREAPENLGTAMKTIIARFQELKKNPLEMQEIDGEEVSFNKVDTALQTIGISLRDTNGQFRELDKVFLDIAQRWDGLTQTQQRYIATTAAGSRQQSRFIAMMSNYARTTELMSYANDSAGASQEQFEKTLDSLESKLNQLHNAWQQFTMGIANNKMIKGAVDLLADGLGIINKLIDTLSLGSGTIKSLLSLFTAFTGLKAGGKIINSLIGGLGGMLDPSIGFGKGFFGGASRIRQNSGTTQAKAISDPIVSVLNQILGVISSGALGQTSKGGPANYKDYKEANTSFRATAKQPNATVGGVLSSLSKLDGQQVQSIIKSNPGITAQLQRSLVGSDLGKVVGRQLIAGLKQGAIDGSQLQKINKGTLGTFLGTKEAEAYSQTFKEKMPRLFDAQLKQARGEMWHSADRNIQQLAAETTGKNHSDLMRQFDYNKETGEKIENPLYNKKYADYMKEQLKQIQEYNKQQSQMGGIPLEEPKLADRLAEGIGRVGSAAMTAGQGCMALGNTLKSMGFEAAGNAATSFGSALSNLGMIINGLPSLITALGNPAVLAGTLAVGAIAAATVAYQNHIQKIKDNAEKITTDFKDKNEKHQTNVNNLESYREDFARLSAGVDQNGINVSLDASDYDRYLQIVDDIAAINPEIVEGYNAQGHAIINNNKALQETLDLEKKRQKDAFNTYIEDDSTEALQRARDLQKVGKYIDERGNYQQGNKFYDSERKTDGYEFKPQTEMRKNAQQIGKTLQEGIRKGWATEDLLSDFNIDIEQLAKGDDAAIQAFEQNMGKIQSRISSTMDAAGDDIKDKTKQKMTDAFSGYKEASDELDELITPMYEQMSAKMSQSPLVTQIPDEMRTYFNQGLKDIVSDANIKDVDKAANDLATHFSAFTSEGSDYAKVMDQVAEAQDAYAASLDAGAYEQAANDATSAIEQMRQKLVDEGVDLETGYGKALSEFLDNEIAKIESFTEEGAANLSNALNTMTDEIAAAEGALESFNAVAEGSNYSTAASNMAKIYEEATQDIHTAGEGDQTFWAGAEAIVGRDNLIGKSREEAQSLMKSVNEMLKGGEEGWNNFKDRYFNTIDAMGGKLKDANGDIIKGIEYDENGVFSKVDENINPDVYKEMATALKMSEDSLVAMLNLGRQFGEIDFKDLDEARKAIATSDSVIAGRNVDANGNRRLYMKEDALNAELAQAGLDLNEQEKTKAQLEAEQNVKIISEAGKMTANEFKDMGIKSMDSLIDVFDSTGQFTKDEMAEYAEQWAKLNDVEYDPTAFNEKFNEHLQELQDPEAAKQTGQLTDINSTTASILSVLASKRIEEGHLDAAQADNIKNSVLGGKGADTVAQLFSLGKNEKGKALTETEYKGTRDELVANQKTLSDYLTKLNEGRDVAKTQEEKAKFDTEIQSVTETLGYLNKYIQDGDAAWKATQEKQEAEANKKKAEAEKQQEEANRQKQKAEEEKAKAEQSKQESDTDKNRPEYADKEYWQNRDEEPKYSTLPPQASTILGEIANQGFEQLFSSVTPESINTDAARQALNSVYAATLETNGATLTQDLMSDLQTLGVDIQSAIDAGLVVDRNGIYSKANQEGQAASEAVSQGIEDGTESTEPPKIDATGAADTIQQGINEVVDNINNIEIPSITPPQPGDANFVGPVLPSQQTQSETSTAQITVDNTEANSKLQETQTKAEQVSQTIAQGADFLINVIGAEDLTKAARDAQNLSKSSGAKTVGVKASFDGSAATAGVASINGMSAKIKVGANTAPALTAAEAARKTIDSKSATINVSTSVKGQNVDIYVTKHVKEAAKGQNNTIVRHSLPSFGSAAKGRYGTIGPKDKGGLTLTGEKGFEIAWIPSESRSMILGANGPQMLNLPDEAVIYTHEQSKKILQQKSIPAGSHMVKANFSRTSTAATTTSFSSSGNPAKQIADNAKKTGDKVAKDVENTTKAIARVTVWWENHARKAEGIQRKTDQNQNEYEKYLKDLKATLRKTGTTGQGNAFIINNEAYISEQQTQYNKAKDELSQIATGKWQSGKKAGKKATSKKNKKKKKKKNQVAYEKGADNILQVSYEGKDSKGKKTTKTSYVNTARYVYWDKATSSYQIDQSKLKKIKNKDKRKQVADALNKEINDRTSKRNSAEDNIRKAQEALEKFSEELYNTFFAWENELTEIWNITQRIEQAQSRISGRDAFDDLIDKQLSTGMMKGDDNSRALNLTNFKERLALQNQALQDRQEAIAASKDALQRLLTSEDERTTLTNVNNKLNADTQAAQKASKLAKLNEAKRAQKNYKEAVAQKKYAESLANKYQARMSKLSKKKKLSKKEQEELKFLRQQWSYQKAQAKKYNKAIKDNKTLAGQVDKLQKEYNSMASGATLNETQRLGYQQYQKELEDQIKAQDMARKFTKITKRADGTIDIRFDTTAFENERLNGNITSDMAKAVQDWVKKIQEASADLQKNYEDLTKEITDYYSQLDSLQDEWANYGKELTDITESYEKQKIDKIKQLADSVKKALDKLLTEVKQKLDERRKQEENAQTERDISQKQQRLSMLRADTAGGHQVEIAQLEKEIAEAQRNYQISLEDQLLDKLQQQADLASEQRERQIELQEALASSVNNIAQVNEWMRRATSIGAIEDEDERAAEYDELKEEIREGYYANKNYDIVTEAEQIDIESEFEQFFNGLISNQEKQQQIIDTINQLEPLVKDIRDLIRKQWLTLDTAKEGGMTIRESEQQFGASLGQLRTEGKYTFDDFKQAGYTNQQIKQAGFGASEFKSKKISYTDAKAAGYSLDELEKGGYTEATAEKQINNAAAEKAAADARKKAADAAAAKAEQAKKEALHQREVERRQTFIRTYNSALAAYKNNKKISSAEINNLFGLGKQFGLSKAAVLQDIVSGKPFTWKNTMGAILGANGINRWNLLKTFPNNSALEKALAEYLGKKISEIKSGSNWKNAKAFATGGLNTYTGPAWLDGTPSKPELVLNAQDTKNFIALKDVLSKAIGSTSHIENSYGGDANFEININVDHISNDYDVNKVVDQVEKRIVQKSGYRNVTQVRNFR